MTPRGMVCALTTLLLAGACSPREFDRLAQPGERPDASTDDGGSEDVDAGALPDAAPPRPDAQVDAAVDAGPDGAVPDGAVSDGGCPTPPAGGAALPTRSEVVVLARLSHPSSVPARRLGPSIRLGATRLWSFSFTQLTPGLVRPPDVPSNHPSFALDGEDRPSLRMPVDPAAPWRLSEQLDASGLPRALFPLRAAEQGMDIGRSASSLIATDDPARVLAYVTESRGFQAESVRLFEIGSDGTMTPRSRGPLFEAPAPLFALGAHRGDKHVHVFSCAEDLRCRVARAPVDKLDQRDAYEVRSQDASGAWTWDRDLSKGTPVIEGVFQDLSVTYNAYLGRYLAVHSAWVSNLLVLQTAPSPEGPWTKTAEVTLPAPKAFAALIAREHPSLQSRCGQRIIVSHWAPSAMVGPLPTDGEVVLSAIELQ